MSDMGSLFHCRRPLRTEHAITRDGTKPHREVRIEQSVPENSEATRSAGKVQLSDGLASAHEHRCGSYMAAACDSRNGDGALVRVEMGVWSTPPANLWRGSPKRWTTDWPD